MDLFRSMNAFVTTVRVGSMSAAAQELGMTAAMVGQHIAGLEARLGSRLLNRTTRRQSLTSVGEDYLEQCKDILERVALADKEAEVNASEAQGRLRITAPVTFGNAVLMPALAKFRQHAPRVTLDVVLTDKNVDIVEEGIDVAFRIGDIPDSRIVQRVLMPYRMRVCASPSYLKEHGVPNTPEELAAHAFVGFSPASSQSLTLSRDTQQVMIKPNYVAVVNSGQGVVNSVKAGLGIAVQPEILVADDLAAGRLQCVLPDWKLGERNVSVLYYRHKNMAPKIRAFIRFALAEFGED